MNTGFELRPHEVEALARLETWLSEEYKIEEGSYSLSLKIDPQSPWLMATAALSLPYEVGIAPPFVFLAIWRQTGEVHEMNGPVVGRSLFGAPSHP